MISHLEGIKKGILYLFLVIILVACGSSKSTQNSNIPKAYTKVETDVRTDYKVFHLDDNTTRIYVKLQTENLLYARNNEEALTAGVTIKFSFSPEKGSKDADIPSKTIRILDEDNSKEPKELLAFTDLNIPFGNNYKVETVVTDINRGSETLKDFMVLKADRNDRQNFITTKTSFLTPTLIDRIEPNTSYRLLVNLALSDTITVHYYDRNFRSPRPPFIESTPPKFDYAPDSVFTLILDLDNQANFESKSEGFYHFLVDENQRNGFTLFVSHKDFPKVRSVEDLAEPFRYVLKSSEIKGLALTERDYRKAQLESYWIDWIGDQERARKSIKAYYKRVEDTNKFFSCHSEGWQTDRGMMYIVYGNPNKVYRDTNKETWIYGEENSPMSIQFDFVKVINPFTNNDYRLIRKEEYKASYTRSVGAWRDGRVY